MTTEYWLQKKTIGGWSQVTRYDNLTDAMKNYQSCVGNGLSGYCWRLCSIQVVEVSMLNDVVEVKPNSFKEEFTKEYVKAYKESGGAGPSGWGVRPADILVQDAPKSAEQPTRRPWGQNLTSNNPTVSQPASSDLAHGLSGSVWLVHHGLKIKTRVSADKVDAMMKEGYVKGSPRTQFEG